MDEKYLLMEELQSLKLLFWELKMVLTIVYNMFVEYVSEIKFNDPM